MINCCHVALTLCGVIFGMLAMFFNYNLKLGARTAQLEKKNGKELKELAELKTRVKELEANQKSNS